MKKLIVVMVVLAAALGTAFAYKLHLDAAALDGPVGSSGTVEGVTVALAPKIGGRIDSIRVQEGDRVQAGDVLVTMDCRDFDAQAEMALAQVEAASARAEGAAANAEAAKYREKAAYSQASGSQVGTGSIRANKEFAQRQLERAVTLNRQDVMPLSAKENYETAEAGLDASLRAADAAARAAALSAKSASMTSDAAGLQVAEARAALKAAEAALERAEISRKECVLPAPVAGTVSIRAREPGEVVMPGATILEITDTTTAKVRFFVRTAEVADVVVGARVNVSADAIPSRSFEGSVARISEKAEFTPRNIQTKTDRDRLVFMVEAHIDNAAGDLKPGMPVEVRLVSVGGAK